MDLRRSSLRLTFAFTLAGAAAIEAQGAPLTDPLAIAREGFGEVHGWVTRSAELVPAERYTYRPVATVRTFGEQVAHIADGYNYYCARAAGRQVQWSDAIEKGKTDKATVVAALKSASAACEAAGQAGLVQGLMANIAHTNLHYGNLIVYLRMMGMTPPSS